MATLHVFTALELQDEFRPDQSQVHILYSQSAITFLFPILAAAALCLLLWEISPRPALLVWAGLVVTYSLGRYGLLWRYRMAARNREESGSWHAAFAASVFVSGVLWGTAPILLVPYEPSRLIEFTLYNGLIVLIISGLVAGAVIAYGVSIRVLLCYVVPALVPPALYLIALGDKFNSALGGFVLLYFVFIGATSIRVRQHFMHFMRIEHDRDGLRRELDNLRRRMEALTGRSVP